MAVTSSSSRVSRLYNPPEVMGKEEASTATAEEAATTTAADADDGGDDDDDGTRPTRVSWRMKTLKMENQESIHLQLTNVPQQKDTKMNVSILMKRASPTHKIN